MAQPVMVGVSRCALGPQVGDQSWVGAQKILSNLDFLEFSSYFVLAAWDELVVAKLANPLALANLLKGAKFIAELKGLTTAAEQLEQAVKLAEGLEKITDAEEKLQKAKEIKAKLAEVKKAAQ